MKKIISFLFSLPFFFISCSDDDSKNSNEPEFIKSSITKTELESVSSFVYNDDVFNDILFIKFRNGKLYTKQITSSGFVCNQNIMDYVMTGDKIDIVFESYGSPIKFDGTIHKVIEQGETKKLVLDLDSKYQVARWLSNTYEWSTTDF